MHNDATQVLLGANIITKDEANARFEYLSKQREAAWAEYLATTDEEDREFDHDDFELEDAADQEDLEFLEQLLENAYHCSGEEFIHASHFEDYARVEACEVFRVVDTIADFVDWKKWAAHLRQDYRDVAPPGYTYWCRA